MSPIINGDGSVSFNSAGESVYGDYIEQTFSSPVQAGNTISVSMDLFENGGGVSDNDFTIELRSSGGSVIDSRNFTVLNQSTNNVDYNVVLTGTASLIRIINTNSTNTVSTDSKVDNVSVMADITPPTVAITGVPAITAGTTPFTATFTFFEAVTGFDLADINAALTNATASAFNATSTTIYTATITPNGAGDVTVGVDSGAAQDAATNDNTAATNQTATLDGDRVKETQRAIATFMSNRADHIMNNQPDLIGFVARQNLGGRGRLGSLNLNANAQNLNLAFSTSRSEILAAHVKRPINQILDPEGYHSDLNARAGRADANNPTGSQYALSYTGVEDDGQHELGVSGNYGHIETTAGAGSRAGTWDIWTEIHGSASNIGNSRSSLWAGYVGAHYFISENQLIGLIGQLDWADETNEELGGNADGFGWMAGPYIAGQFPGQNLFYETRVSYGRSDNNISPVGTYSDTFTTERWHASGKLSGLYDINDLTVRPEIRISQYEETRKNYTNSLSNLIPEQTISLGELRFGSGIQRNITHDNGTILTPEIALNGVWNFDVNKGAESQVASPGDDRFRARVELGLAMFRPENGLRITTSAYYDGIGISNYDAWGGRASMTIPLN